MCYNAETSIVYFIIISIIIIFLWIRNKNNDRICSIIFIFINLVQLGEFFIWKGLNKNVSLNQFGSKLIKLSIYMQPLIIVLCSYFIKDINIKLKKILLVISIIYVIIFGIEIINTLFHKINPSKNIGFHLDWNNNLFTNTYFNPILLRILYFISFMFILFQSNIILSMIIVIFIYLSFAINFFSLKNNTWQSMWCFLGNFTPIIYLILTTF
jgi:hypothetical protein